MNKRNSSLELLKFIYALIIAYYHDYFFVDNNEMSNGRYATAFFFILAGFFILPSLQKYMEYPTKIAIFKFIKDKLFKLGIPLLVGYIFSLISTIVSKDFSSGVLHLLWFVHVLIIYEAILLFLYKRINNENNFFLLIFIIYIATLIARLFSPLKLFDELECFVLVSLGILLSQAKVELLDKNPTSYILLLITFLSSLLIIFYLENELYELLLKFIIFPVMILSAYSIKTEVKLFNYLGRLSPAIYLYQPMIRFFDDQFELNKVVCGLSLIILAVITDLIVQLYKKKYRYQNK